MARALDLARGMRGHVWPNPPVGCVVIKDGICVAEAATRHGGRPHAERTALDNAKQAAREATLYVTLEPCSHWGKTPPCVDAIIASGIHRVVASLQAPDPRVDGSGFEQLRAAGIVVDVGEGAEEARRIMAGFLHRVRTGRPSVTLLDDPTDAVPEGKDALLLTKNGFPTLVLRTSLTSVNESPLIPHADSADFLLRLGMLGLTSVAVHVDDPILIKLESHYGRHWLTSSCEHHHD